MQILLREKCDLERMPEQIQELASNALMSPLAMKRDGEPEVVLISNQEYTSLLAMRDQWLDESAGGKALLKALVSPKQAPARECPPSYD